MLLENLRKYSITILALFTIIGVIYLLRYCEKSQTKNTSDIYTITIRDTIIDTVYIQRKPIFIKSKAEIKYLRDTIIQTRPFEASLDTITTRKDTIQVKYLFPDAKFDLMLRLSQDTLKQKTIQTSAIEYKKEDRPLWLDILSHTGAFILGGLIIRK